MIRDTKIYLKQYLIKEAKLSRLKQMKNKYPNRRQFYQEKIKNVYKERNKIEEKIESVDEELLREILYNKYILGKSLEEISIIINYSKRHTERLHMKALKKIQI